MDENEYPLTLLVSTTPPALVPIKLITRESTTQPCRLFCGLESINVLMLGLAEELPLSMPPLYARTVLYGMAGFELVTDNIILSVSPAFLTLHPLYANCEFALDIAVNVFPNGHATDAAEYLLTILGPTEPVVVGPTLNPYLFIISFESN
jgi:hypothetical protein